jgi:hypothetical protein
LLRTVDLGGLFLLFFYLFLKSSTVTVVRLPSLCFVPANFNNERLFFLVVSATSDIANVDCLYIITRGSGLAMYYPSETATASPLLAYPPSPPLPVERSLS